MYELGAECGKFYSVNVPLKEGIDDQSECCGCAVETRRPAVAVVTGFQLMLTH